MPNGLPEAFARVHFVRELLGHRIMKAVRTVMHGESKVGLLCAPDHRSHHTLIVEVNEPNAAAFESRCLNQERLQCLRCRVRLVDREENPRAILPFYLIPRH